MTPFELLPAARPIDATPFQEDGQIGYVLRDSSRIATRPVAVSGAGYFLLAHLDGQHTAGDVQLSFLRQFGQFMPYEQVETLVNALDDACLLDTPRFRAEHARRAAAYSSAPTRDNRGGWGDAELLRTELASMLATGKAFDGAADRLLGIIAPHLDYARGWPCYAAAYATLAQATDVRRYVILGVNHFGQSTSVVATTKDFETPLGVAYTDRAFIEKLEQRLGAALCQHEFDHLAEHSVELQSHLLQSLRPDGDFVTVPLLCPNPTGPSGTAPCDGVGPDLRDFADALAEMLLESRERTLLIAGADLSHVGRRFGEPQPTTPEFMQRIERHDRRLLAMLEARRESDLLEAVRRAGNPTRICSIGNLYAFARALPNATIRTPRYHQATDFEAETHVTCAAGYATSR